ncbi:hypothetical protein LTR36_008662 [Oleoguttula mirabilis]|uniref:Beta-lactamase-related domain-containing protein n=1 Tax=Oleoguttula mirabilis TaxID=1507867 RepID=A0AAV9JTR3_9PEZI|nr:hypothetical protein LTR36_008662 [Oleoguttula mirabilis]
MAVLDDLLRLVSVDALAADGVPSASIAILEDGKISTTMITNGGDDDEDTVYQACSISKAITALAVARLVDDGRLSYDTCVADRLPRSIVECIIEPATAHLMQHVTVRMLVSHTSGLSQHGFPGYVGDLPTSEDILAGRAPSNTPGVRFNSFPGAQFSYSGGGFTVLQLFLEQVMEMEFSDIMQEVVLKPLGMRRSRYGALLPEERNYAKAHHTAYTPAGVEYHRFVELAAGGLWTTPTDLLKAVAAIQQSLHTDTGFLRRKTAKQILTQVPQTDEHYAMAFGWGADNSVFAHRGDNEPGFNCYAFGSHGGVVNADTDTGGLGVPCGSGLAILTNSVLGFEAVRKIVSVVFYLKGWPRFRSLACGYGDDDYVPYAAPEGTAVDGGWREWIGDWGSVWQLVNDGGPKLVFHDLPPMALRPAAAPIGFVGGLREHFFVVHGLETAVRLTWCDEQRVVALIQCEGARTLKRT